MDAFSIRLELVSLLRKLNASQASINKVLALAIRHAARNSEDIWSCIMQECQRASLNARVNLFFLLDALFTDDAFSHPAVAAAHYHARAQRDLRAIVDIVVPREALTLRSTGQVVVREGAGLKLNAGSVLPILAGWKMRQVFDTELIEALEAELQERKAALRKQTPLQEIDAAEANTQESFSKADVVRRMEEDRERVRDWEGDDLSRESKLIFTSSLSRTAQAPARARLDPPAEDLPPAETQEQQRRRSSSGGAEQ